MSKKNKILVGLMPFLFMIIIGNTTRVQAASASITNSKTVTQGDNVTVTASVNAGAWNLNLSGAGQSKGLVGQTSVTDNASASTSISFNATSVGTYTFTLKGDITDYYTEVPSNVSKTCTITVKAKDNGGSTNSGGSGDSSGGNNKNGGSTNSGGSTNNGSSTTTTSSTAELKMITTSPVDFKGFKSASEGPYKVTVENNVTTLNVSVSKKDNGQKVSISGNKNLDVGTNKVSVAVTSADGKNSKTYTIYVTRKSPEEEQEKTPNKPDEEDVKLALSSITLKDGYTLSPEFNSNIYEYTVEIKEDLKEFPIKAIATKDDAKIEITGNEELVEGENIVTIKVTSADEKEKVEYKIKVIKTLEKQVAAPIVTKTKTTPMDFNTFNEINNYSIAIIAMIVVITLIGIIAVILEYSNTRLALAEGDFEDNAQINTTKDYFNYGSTFIDEKPQKKRGRSKGKHS